MELNAIVVLMNTGNIALIDNAPDGSWEAETVSAQGTTASKDIVEQFVTRAEQLRVATVIAAAKVNFYKENHHVGQNQAENYCTKVLRLVYNVNANDIGPLKDDAQCETIYRLYIVSHWASTLSLLSQLGLRGLRQTVAVAQVNAANIIRPATDISMRLASNPAGTARIAYELAKRMRSACADVRWYRSKPRGAPCR